MKRDTKQKRKKQANTIRIFRKIHRYTGASLFLLFLFVSISGLLLGWKKHSGDIILSKTYEGSSSDFKKWQPLEILYDNAQNAFRDSISTKISNEIDRIDVRKDKGTVKFTFKEDYWGIQLDGATGKVLHIEKRRSDFIEQIHDGSILDDILGTSNGQIKLLYTTITGVALLVFTVTGFWLWYGPKRMRRLKNQ